MKKTQQIIELVRLDKPIGYLLLFWPCLWGLTLANYYNQNFKIFFLYIMFFFLGSVLMRSAGCIINDIVDRKFDKKISRTKSRPIASGKVKIFEAVIYTSILCFLALIILIQFNVLTIELGMASMVLAFTYPFMKRLTYWPQLFLGFTFNWGIIMAWSAIHSDLSITPFILYIAAIFWTLGYDTIYGLQDLRDDEIIGLKSTSIKFQNNVKNFVTICYLLTIAFLIILTFFIDTNFFYFLILMLIAYQFYLQIKNFNKNRPETCLKAFKSNNYIGILVFISLLTNYI